MATARLTRRAAHGGAALAAPIVALALLALGPARAEAASFQVDSVADMPAVDDSGDGVCDADPSPLGTACTLRAAVQESNGVAGPDVILLPALGGAYTVSLGSAGEDLAAQGDLDVLGPLSVEGSGQPTINGAGLDRVLQVGGGLSAGALTLSGVDLRGGGGVADGGAILVENGTLALDRVAIEANSAQAGPGNASGGGVWIASEGAHTISASTIADNNAIGGASARAGGVGVASPFATVAVTNSTITGNHATSALGTAKGGGVWMSGGTMLSHVTLHQNSTDGGIEDEGGNIYADGAPPTLFGTVISAGISDPGVENCEGQFKSSGGNVEAHLGSVGQCGLSSPADRFAENARLAPLADRGGPTRTHALLSPSPALDFVPSCFPIDRDQRGEPRPSAFACDAGSFERQVLPPRKRCFGQRATIFGFGAGERIVGTPKADVIVSLGGNDRVYGRGGRDLICAGGGADRVWGGPGHDKIAGDGGNDKLWGNAGRDRLEGRGGRDYLNGGKQRDVLDGGGGKDRCVGRADKRRKC